MNSNDALLLFSLMKSNPERDGPDPFGFTRTPSTVSTPSASKGAASERSLTRRVGFVAANDLDATSYTILLRSVIGIDPLGVYEKSGCERSKRSEEQQEATPATVIGSVGSLFATVQAFHLGEALTPVIQSSASLGPREGFPQPLARRTQDGLSEWEEVFDEMLSLALPVSSLPLDCEVRCLVYNTEQGLVGGCAFSPFTIEGELRTGHVQLPINYIDPEIGVQALSESTSYQEEVAEWEKHAHALDSGVLPGIPWLDAVTRQHLNALCHGNGMRRRASREAMQQAGVAGLKGSGDIIIPGAYLHLHLPTPSRAVPVVSLSDPMDAVTGGCAPVTTTATFQPSAYHPTVTLPYVDHYRTLREGNVCEAAAAVAARSTFLLYAANATPGRAERERLLQIADRPPVQLEPLRLEDVALLWRYRDFITRDTRLFIPFMRSVDWRAAHQGSVGGAEQQQQQRSAERRVACELISRWRPLELAQVLGCLSATFRGVQPVREYALRLLDRESDDLLCWIAPQLVQSLRYDGGGESGRGVLTEFLVRRALGNWELCAALHWGAAVEAEVSGTPGAARSAAPIAAFRVALEETLERAQTHYLARLRDQQALRRCLASLHSTLHSAPGDRNSRIIVGKRLLAKRACGFAELFTGPRAGNVAAAASTSVTAGHSNIASSRAVRGVISTHSQLDVPGTVTLPTHPAFAATGVNADSFFMFKSAKQPLQVGFSIALPAQEEGVGTALARCVFTPLAVSVSVSAGNRSRAPRGAGEGAQPSVTTSTTTTPASPRELEREVRLMFKVNDDVRQDQLVVQLIHWMDALLRLDGLDLCLTPFRVLATGEREGLVEVVPDVVTFQSVQRDALRYLRVHNPTSEGLRLAMDRYTRSFAGYSVITFVLGIGDRHLENILLARDGRLLHIDFGYILGHDPKPFPPPMKISGEMLEVLGGPESPGYTEFKSYCCVAYNIVRKHAALLLSLLQLMCHAEGLPQLTGETLSAGDDLFTAATAVQGADAKGAGTRTDPLLSVLKVQERLRLDLTNAQATQYIQNVIADSVGSIFTGLWDVLHAAAQATRA